MSCLVCQEGLSLFGTTLLILSMSVEIVGFPSLTSSYWWYPFHIINFILSSGESIWYLHVQIYELIYLSFAWYLNTGCLREGPVLVTGVEMPSFISFIATAMTFAASMATCVIACFSASASAIFPCDWFSFWMSFSFFSTFYFWHHTMLSALHEIMLMVYLTWCLLHRINIYVQLLNSWIQLSIYMVQNYVSIHTVNMWACLLLGQAWDHIGQCKALWLADHKHYMHFWPCVHIKMSKLCTSASF